MRSGKAIRKGVWDIIKQESKRSKIINKVIKKSNKKILRLQRKKERRYARLLSRYKPKAVTDYESLKMKIKRVQGAIDFHLKFQERNAYKPDKASVVEESQRNLEIHKAVMVELRERLKDMEDNMAKKNRELNKLNEEDKAFIGGTVVG
jgi:hypothetical protein